MSAYDVAVVGAGPAGSVAALMLARAGLDVALIGIETSETGNPRRGETVSPIAASVLARLQLTKKIDLQRMPRVTGFVSTWGSPRALSRPGFLAVDAGTLSVDRAVLDDALKDAAAECGATVLPGRVDAMAYDGVRWRISHRRTEYHARFLIDASGRGARFARRAGARLLAFDKLIAVTAVLASAAEDKDRTVAIESLPDGWLFTTLDAVGDRVVTFFTDGDLWPADALKHPDPLLDRILAGSRTLAGYSGNARRLGTRVWSAGSFALDHAGRPGLLAVGDAAQTRDPLSSQGISSAMRDAESAASLLAASFGDDLSSAIEVHEKGRRRQLIQYLKDRYLYYRAETRWPERAFWRRRHDLGLLLPQIAAWRTSGRRRSSIKASAARAQ